ncbi:MAG TPA: hypothetical protein VHO28_10530 [Ignavibacteriales bacterium]|nr:hypothetical protein [Ignavibacteriales bacterium]
MKVILFLIYAAAFLFMSSFNSKDDIMQDHQQFTEKPETKDSLDTARAKLKSSVFNFDILEINKKYMSNSGLFPDQDTVKDPC